MKRFKFIWCFILIVCLLSACSIKFDENLSLTQRAASTAFAEKATSESNTTSASVQAEQTAVLTQKNMANEQTYEEMSEQITASEIEQTNRITTEKNNFCIIRIECETIYDNLEQFEESKKDFLPSSEIILNDARVELNGGESVFDVLQKACRENVCTDNCETCRQNGILFEYEYTPAFDNYYIEGIHQIYEKDCGQQSGWMYSVNGAYPDVGASSYKVSAGDLIVFTFTCNSGEDIGNSY